MPELEAFDLIEVSALCLHSKGHINVKKGAFNHPVYLSFHFFQPNLTRILRFTTGIY